MPDYPIIFEWIKEGEGESLDFKKRVDDPVKIAKTLVAFANKNGGILVIGIDDEGEVTGVDINQEKHILKKAAKDYCSPSIPVRFHVLRVDVKRVLVVEIDQRADELHIALDDEGNGQVYIRERDKTMLAEQYQANVASKESDRSPILIHSGSESGLLGYLKKNQLITVQEYIQLMNLPYQEAKRSLDHLVETGVLKFHPSKKEPYYTLN